MGDAAGAQALTLTPTANTLVNIGQSQTISVSYRVGGIAPGSADTVVFPSAATVVQPTLTAPAPQNPVP